MKADLAMAKELLKEAGRYLEQGDANRAAPLIQKAERIVIAVAKEQARGKTGELGAV